MSFVRGQEELQAKKQAGMASSFLNCYLHVAIKSFLKLSLRNSDPHDLSHTSSANKAVSIASLTSGGSALMPSKSDTRKATVTAQLRHGAELQPCSRSCAPARCLRLCVGLFLIL